MSTEVILRYDIDKMDQKAEFNAAQNGMRYLIVLQKLVSWLRRESEDPLRRAYSEGCLNKIAGLAHEHQLSDIKRIALEENNSEDKERI